MSYRTVENMPNSICYVLVGGNQLVKYIPRIEYIYGEHKDKHVYYIL